MAHRWLLAATLIAGLAISGCSSGSKTTTPPGSTTKSSTSASASSSSSSSETTEAAPTTTLDISQCVDVTGANADLLTANDKDAARKAMDEVTAAVIATQTRMQPQSTTHATSLLSGARTIAVTCPSC